MAEHVERAAACASRAVAGGVGCGAPSPGAWAAIGGLAVPPGGGGG